MAKFSVGGEDDIEGPSSRRQKRPRIFVEEENEDENCEEEVEEDGEDEEEDEEDEEDEEEEEEEESQSEDGEGRVGSNGGGLSVGPNRDGSIRVTLTDPEVLDCSICYDSLKIPVYQCENGHIACSPCCIKLGNRCPSCSFPIGYNRCRAIEKVLESVKTSCKNIKYGCRETVSYNKKHDHEEACIYAPCSCPLPDCNFIGSSKQLSQHFSLKHSSCAKGFRYDCLFPVSLEMNDKFLVLQEEHGGMLFILNNSAELLGNAVTVSRIGPRSSKREFSYDLVAKKVGSSLRLQSFTESVSGRVNNRSSMGFLLVPSAFFGSCGQLKLELCIRTKDATPAGF
ncbi:hypothetical protein L1049_010752 [Liquidambar formosana]|uniref:RING-type E3 ubiquitin transferase n=1 Tax=Liquidambar formosana TaxID=63359 RepID=A0AAP0N6H3_LIQFO